jgi:hypothetical protein
MYIVDGTDMGINPARVNLDTGRIEINRALFDKYPQSTRDIILAHEKGHYVKQTFDEHLADSFAIEYLAGKSERSLRKSVSGLITALKDCNIPEARKINIVKTALRIDAEKFGNKNAKYLLEQMSRIQRKQNTANAIGPATIVSAATSLATSFIATGNGFLWGPKAAWFKGERYWYTESPDRKTTVRYAVSSAMGYTLNYAPSGIDKVYTIINNDNEILDRTFGCLKTSGTFLDSNAGTKNVTYKDMINKAPWYKKVVLQERDNLKGMIDAQLKQAGYDVDGTNSSSSKTKYIVIAAIGIAAIMGFIWLRRR